MRSGSAPASIPTSGVHGPGPLALILPAALAATLVIAAPLVQLARLSTHGVSRFGRLGGFTGFENFVHLLADPALAGSAWRTLVWVAAVVGGTLLVSLPAALVLDQRFYGRGLARLIVLLPWSVSLSMTAVVWRRALNGETGLLNTVLRGLGLMDQPVAWLASAGSAFPIEVLVGVLVSVPFCTAILLGGLTTIPAELREAVRLDGAGPWQRCLHLTLPQLRPFLGIAVIFNVAYVSNSLPIIWVMTGGGPAGGTDILVTHLYKLAFVFGRLGDAAALSMLLFAGLLVAAVAIQRLALAAVHA